jgi:hypothetical protein
MVRYARAKGDPRKPMQGDPGLDLEPDLGARGVERLERAGLMLGNDG